MCGSGASHAGTARDFKPDFALESGVKPVARAGRIDGAHQRVVVEFARAELKGRRFGRRREHGAG